MLYETDTDKVIVCSNATGPVFKEYGSHGVGMSTASSEQLHYLDSPIFNDSGATWYIGTQADWHYDALRMNGADTTGNPADGAVVTSWEDRSGNSLDLSNSSGSAQPIYRTKPAIPYGWAGPSVPHVWFDNDTLSFDSSYTTVGVHTYIGIHQRAISYNSATLSRAFDSYQFLSLAESVGVGTNATIKYLGRFTSGSFDSYSKPVLVVGRRDSSNNLKIWVNGGSSQYSATHASNYTLTTMGRSSSDSIHFETMMFPTDLSLADINKVREYLQNKWGSTNLATTEIT